METPHDDLVDIKLIYESHPDGLHPHSISGEDDKNVFQMI